MNKYHKGILLGLIIISLLAYFQSLSFDFVNWDDDLYVTNNRQVTNPNTEHILSFFTEENAANYHPITMLSFALNYAIDGENPFGYHLFNVIFHLLNTLLLYLWVRKVWKDQPLLPFFVAGIFALHPMHVESVAWISSRKDVLFFFFYFIALIGYQNYITSKKLKYLGVVLVFFVLSALSKPVAVVFPIHLLLIDYLSQRKLNGKLVLEKSPFFIVSILVGLATVYVQNDAGAVNFTAFSFLERIQLASYAINQYFIKFISPVHLSSFYPYPQQPFGWTVSLSPLLLFLVIGILLWRFRKHRNIVFGLLFFIVSLVLLVQLVTVGSTIIAERYTYLAYVGLSIAIFFILRDLFPQKIDFTGNPALVIISIVLLAFSFLTFNRVKVWENGKTLWTDAIEKFPEVAGSWGGRGVYYRQQKQYTKALSDFNKAISLNPNEHMFYSNRGNIFFDQGNNEKALSDYNNCLRLKAKDENALTNRGAIYGRNGAFEKAIQDFNNAITINPEFINAYKNRAIIYGQLNERAKAKSDFKKCIELDPKQDQLWNALAVEHQHLGEFDASISVLDNAIRLSPKEGVYYLNRGISFRLLGDQQSANADFNKAKSLGVTVNPGYYQRVE